MTYVAVDHVTSAPYTTHDLNLANSPTYFTSINKSARVQKHVNIMIFVARDSTKSARLAKNTNNDAKNTNNDTRNSKNGTTSPHDLATDTTNLARKATLFAKKPLQATKDYQNIVQAAERAIPNPNLVGKRPRSLNVRS